MSGVGCYLTPSVFLKENGLPIHPEKLKYIFQIDKTIKYDNDFIKLISDSVLNIPRKKNSKIRQRIEIIDDKTNSKSSKRVSFNPDKSICTEIAITIYNNIKDNIRNILDNMSVDAARKYLSDQFNISNKSFI